VIASRPPGITVATSVVYFPDGDASVIEAADGQQARPARGRRTSPSAWRGLQRYARVSATPPSPVARANYHALAAPLSCCRILVDDYLNEHEFYGARSVMLSARPAKTASASRIWYHLADIRGDRADFAGNTKFVQSLVSTTRW